MRPRIAGPYEIIAIKRMLSLCHEGKLGVSRHAEMTELCGIAPENTEESQTAQLSHTY